MRVSDKSGRLSSGLEIDKLGILEKTQSCASRG